MGIATPFIYANDSLNQGRTMINLNNVNSIDRYNIDANNAVTNSAPEFKIIFSMNGHNQNLQQLELVYRSEQNRDRDYEAIQSWVGVSLPDTPEPPVVEEPE